MVASASMAAAEHLFESRSITEIRQIEQQTRSDVVAKKVALRALVGESYRDLIETTDKIVNMASICNEIMTNVKNVQGGFTSLTHSFASSENLLQSDKRDALTKHEELYAVGSRVKYIVDTPEVIWGSLDANLLLEATKRLLRAEHVHELLHLNFPTESLARFPLLAHQWPVVKSFRKHIMDAVNQVLTSEASLASDAVAVDAIAAAAALEGLSCEAALDLLLSSRSALLSQQLQGGMESHSSGGEGGSLLAAQRTFAHLAQSVQSTMSQVGEIFLPSHRGSSAPAAAMSTHSSSATHPSSMCLLRSSVVEDEADASELLFSGQGRQSPSLSLGSPSLPNLSEAEAWRSSCCKISDGLVALTLTHVEKACLEWLRSPSRGVALLLQPNMEALLRACCSSARDLVDVERAVLTAIATWQPLLSSSSSALTAAGHLAPPPSLGSAWEAVCQGVLGFSLSLWTEIFHPPFLSRCKEIVEARFQAAARGIQAPLQSCLDAACNMPPQSPGQVLCPLGRWPSSSSSSSSSPAAAADSSDEGYGAFRGQVHSIRSGFDDEMSSILHSALLLLTPSDEGLGGLGRQGSVGGGSASKPSPASHRAVDLEAFVQEKCVETTASIAAYLRGCLGRVGRPKEDSLSDSKDAEQVLVIGRLCSGLASESRMLPVILGPPESWRVFGGGEGAIHKTISHGSSTSALSVRPKVVRGGAGVVSQKLQSVAESFQSIAFSCYRMWAAWAASGLSSSLHSSLCGQGGQRYSLHPDGTTAPGPCDIDTLFSSSSTPLSWLEVVVPIAPAASSPASSDLLMMTSSSSVAAGQDPSSGTLMRFYLPSGPSPTTVTFLSAVCHEVMRAGDHAVSLEAVQVLAWESLGAALGTLCSLLGLAHSPSSPRGGKGSAALGGTGRFSSKLSEKGVLQLLMDVRLMRDVLGGGKPVGPADTTSSLAERKREGLGLEQHLQDRLDPIDWATYEPYFWASSQRYASRVSLLFGSLMQLQRPPSSATPATPPSVGASSLSSESNPLNLLPVAPRFQYLPISAPSMAASNAASNAQSKASFNLLRLHGAGRGTSASGQESSNGRDSDMASGLSFADVGQGVGGAAFSSEAQQSGATPTGSSLGDSMLHALQQRLQAGTAGLSIGDISGLDFSSAFGWGKSASGV